MAGAARRGGPTADPVIDDPIRDRPDDEPARVTGGADPFRVRPEVRPVGVVPLRTPGRVKRSRSSVTIGWSGWAARNAFGSAPAGFTATALVPLSGRSPVWLYG